MTDRPPNDPLAPLLEDHAIARRALDAIESMAARPGHFGADGGTQPSWRLALAFFDEYFDRVHHPKEEYLLLPLLAGSNYTGTHDAPAQMRREHELLAPARQELRRAVERGPAADLHEVARDFVRLHREHMAFEERQVFPMARAVLDSATQEELRQGLLAMDGERARARRLVADLEEAVRRRG